MTKRVCLSHHHEAADFGFDDGVHPLFLFVSEESLPDQFTVGCDFDHHHIVSLGAERFGRTGHNTSAVSCCNHTLTDIFTILSVHFCPALFCVFVKTDDIVILALITVALCYTGDHKAAVCRQCDPVGDIVTLTAEHPCPLLFSIFADFQNISIQIVIAERFTRSGNQHPAVAGRNNCLCKISHLPAVCIFPDQISVCIKLYHIDIRVTQLAERA